MATSDLLGLAVLLVLPAARTELLQREAVGIVPLVLFSVVVALLTVGARQRNEHAISLLGHCCACLTLSDSTIRYREPMVRIELTTSPLPRVCSTTELHGPELFSPFITMLHR